MGAASESECQSRMYLPISCCSTWCTCRTCGKTSMPIRRSNSRNGSKGNAPLRPRFARGSSESDRSPSGNRSLLLGMTEGGAGRFVFGRCCLMPPSHFLPPSAHADPPPSNPKLRIKASYIPPHVNSISVKSLPSHFAWSNPIWLASACGTQGWTRFELQRRDGPRGVAVGGDTTASGRFELRRRGGPLDGAAEWAHLDRCTRRGTTCGPAHADLTNETKGVCRAKRAEREWQSQLRRRRLRDAHGQHLWPH